MASSPMLPTGSPHGHPLRVLLPIGLAVAAVAATFALQQVFDGDLWWHLATGRWVLGSGGVPRSDPFSFATAGAPWVAHSWLADVAMVLVHRWGGVDALILAKLAIVAVSFAGAWLLAIRARACPWVAALALWAAVPIAQPQFRERPQLLMFALVPLFYWLLAHPEAERRRSTWIVLLAAMVAWANLHGSFFLGAALGGALVADRAVAALRSAPSRDLRPLGLAAALLVALLAATLVNAYGAALPLQILRDFTSFAVERTATIEEHRALVPSANPGFVALAAVTLLVLATAWRTLSPYDLATFAGFTWLAVSSERFAAVAALLYACILARYVTPFAERAAAALAERAPRLPRAVAPALATTVAALGLVVAFRASFAPGRETRWGLGVNEGRFPVAGVRVLSGAGFAGNVFNSWELGGYLLWHLPASRDLVDGRALPAHFALLTQLSRLDPAALGRWIEGRDVGAALLTRRDPFLPFFSASARYGLAAGDDRSVLYVRTDVAARGGIALRRFQLIRPEEPDPSYLLPLARGSQAAEAERELRRAVQEEPGEFNAVFQLGYFLEARGNPEAMDRYLAAAKLSPGMAFGHHDLGVRAGALAVAAGQIARLEPFLRDGLKVNPRSAPMETLLGTSLQVKRRFADAEAAYGRALRLQPDYPVALKNLGFLLIETRRAREAAPLLEKARALLPADESASYGLAVALDQSGDQEAARRAWRSLIERFPGGRFASAARTRLTELEAR